MRTITIATVLMWAVSAQASMQITEYMYSGATYGTLDGEFIEFTNMDATPINMTGYSFDDNTRAFGSTNLSAFGIVQPGESVILTAVSAATFRTAWGLPASVDVIGLNIENLGRADEINLYDGSNNLVDRLTFDDQTFAGTVRTQLKSGWTPVSNLGPQTINNQWVLSAVSDAQASHTSTGGEIGNPGTYVPEPTTLVLLTLGGAVLSYQRRRTSCI